ncbi:hypothetical protein HYU07_01625 [Candidatus Woesearchaeota archaeon]|nr:hypothetical protein [Candidatus Woesearchaeota archaeon]
MRVKINLKSNELSLDGKLVTLSRPYELNITTDKKLIIVYLLSNGSSTRTDYENRELNEREEKLAQEARKRVNEQAKELDKICGDLNLNHNKSTNYLHGNTCGPFYYMIDMPTNCNIKIN